MEREFILETEQGFNAYDFFKDFKKLQHEGYFKNTTSVRSLDFEVEKEDDFLLRDKFGVR